MESNKNPIGIVVSGGPAPGINSVIAASVIEARNRGIEIYGLLDGFQGICERNAAGLIPLEIENVSRIQWTGGSILGTSRFNPFLNEKSTNAFINTLNNKKIDRLVVIGGDGTAYLSHKISQHSNISVAHIPKTIDNDLVLPDNAPSFGFETARAVGAEILSTLMMDAKTTKRWFLVTSMGRKAGFLALGLGIACGATLTLIPEEFKGQTIGIKDLANIIMKSVNLRIKSGKDYGLVIMAEGLIESIDKTELVNLSCDEIGRIKYSEIELDDILLPELKKITKLSGGTTVFTGKNIGYELRCHTPVSYDIEYTKFLGFGAIRFLCEGNSNFMITRKHDNLLALPLADLMDSNGHCKTRFVDLQSDLYKMASSFMIR